MEHQHQMPASGSAVDENDLPPLGTGPSVQMKGALGDYSMMRDASGTSWDALSMLRGVSEGAMTRFQVARIEPLYAELAAFLQAAAGEPASC